MDFEVLSGFFIYGLEWMNKCKNEGLIKRTRVTARDLYSNVGNTTESSCED